MKLGLNPWCVLIELSPSRWPDGPFDRAAALSLGYMGEGGEGRVTFTMINHVILIKLGTQVMFKIYVLTYSNVT